MIWKYYALSKMGKEHRGIFKGDHGKAQAFLQANDLMVIDIAPDYIAYAVEVLLRKSLSTETLATFFRDFSKMCLAGMTIHEIFSTLSSTTTEPILRDALIKINASLIEGGTLKDAFEKTRAFEPMAVASIDAAEKSGSLPEILTTLSDYYKYTGETRKRVVNAMAYPSLVFVVLTIASIIVSTKLIPQLRSLLPDSATQSIPTQILLGYAWVMEHHWWAIIAIPLGIFLVIKHFWRDYSNTMIGYVYSIPRVGSLLKELELATYFMSLGVYLKSGIVLDEAIGNIHKSQPTYITQRFVQVRAYILGGMSFWSAVEQDKFFPAFVHNNLRKGEEQGRLKEYTHEIYRYYEDKSRESIDIAVKLISPVLLIVIVCMVGFFIFAFFVPLYSSFGNTADQIYK